MPWLNATDKKVQAFHWMPLNGIDDLSFMAHNGHIDHTCYIDFLELSGRQQTARSVKFNMMTLYSDGEDRVITYNVWFADSPQELEDAVANGTPTQIVSSSYGQDPLPLLLSFNVSTRYMAINYDSNKSNHNASYASISIYVS
jgi:hypothetical protein